MKKPILEAKSIIKNFPGVCALNKVDFDIYEGEVHALCGENGAGKSTLMHIFAGVYDYDSGSIFIDGNEIRIKNQRVANELGISIVYQERSLIEGLNVAENVFSARHPVKKASWIDWKKLYRETREILNSLDINIDPKRMVSTLSPAMQQMVEIAKALSIKPKVLVLDEPTATITEKEAVALFELVKKLKENGMAIIFISHRLAEIFSIADRVTILKDGLKVKTANVADINTDWLVTQMVGRELEFKRMKRDLPDEVTDEVVLEVRDFTSDVFKDVSFNLKKGEIIGFAGLTGAGRTEVMRALFGADKRRAGEVVLRGKPVDIKTTGQAIELGICYMPEDRKAQGIFLEMSVAWNIISANIKSVCSGKGRLINKKKINGQAEIYKKKLRIATPSITQKVINLSGGNQQKVVIAKWLMVDSDILIVDEPTRGVDVGVKSEIYEIMKQMTREGKSIIIVSSDLPEVLTISDRIYVMYEGRITGILDGDEASEELIMRYASGIGSIVKDGEYQW